MPWQGERGSGRKTHEALQAALLSAALWHMWEMLVVLVLAPGLSQALANSRAQGTVPNPAATAPAVGRARHHWIRSPGKNSLLQKGKPKQGDAATFLTQRQEEGSRAGDLLCSRKSCSSEGQQDSPGY